MFQCLPGVHLASDEGLVQGDDALRSIEVLWKAPDHVNASTKAKQDEHKLTTGSRQSEVNAYTTIPEAKSGIHVQPAVRIGSLVYLLKHLGHIIHHYGVGKIQP